MFNRKVPTLADGGSFENIIKQFFKMKCWEIKKLKKKGSFFFQNNNDYIFD